MKFGYLKYVRNNINVGDTIQSFGLRAIYKKMGIKDEDIVEVDKRCMSDYAGEYIVLPIASCCDYWYDSRMFPLSNRIIPLFFGFRCVDEAALKDLENFKHNTIFGCRDGSTMQFLRKNGYKAFMSGCISIQSVEKREKLDTQNKILLIDIPEKVKEYIPEEYKNRIVELSSLYDASNLSLDESAKLEVKLAKERLELLRTEAELVVTSRLHCALPCTSMGIPVILTRDETSSLNYGLDNRFMNLNKILDIYTPDEFKNINWHPEVKDISWVKEKQFDILSSMITEIKNKYNDICELSEFFEESEPRVYFNGVSMGYLSSLQKRTFLERRTSETNLLAYIFGRKMYETHIVIWGAGDRGKWMWDRYKDDLLLYKSCIYVDNNPDKQGKKLNNINVLSPNILDKYPLENTIIIIATAHSYDKVSQEIARTLTKKYAFEEGKNYFMLDKLNATAQYAISDFGVVKGWLEEKIWY